MVTDRKPAYLSGIGAGNATYAPLRDFFRTTRSAGSSPVSILKLTS